MNSIFTVTEYWNAVNITYHDFRQTFSFVYGDMISRLINYGLNDIVTR